MPNAFITPNRQFKKLKAIIYIILNVPLSSTQSLSRSTALPASPTWADMDFTDTNFLRQGITSSSSNSNNNNNNNKRG